MDKGTKVRVVKGKSKGQEGEVFWSGPSKYGGGLRLGVRTASGDKIWVAASEVEKAGAPVADPVFLGFDPEDWDEVLHFEVRFVSVPSDDILRGLGQRWARWRVPSSAGDWLFADDFASFSFYAHDGREEDAIYETKRLLKDIHREAPIAEACLGSLTTRPGSTPEKHPAFEEGTAAAFDGQHRAEIERLLADAAKQQIKLVETETPTLPQSEDYPEDARGWLPNIKAELRGPVDAPYVWLLEHHAGSLPAPFDNLALPEGLKYREPATIVVRGKNAIVGLGDSQPRVSGWKGEKPMVLCAVGTDGITPIWRAADHDSGISAYAWIDDGHVAVTTGKRTVVVSVPDGELVAKAKGYSGPVIGVSWDGRLVVGAKRVFAWLSGKLIDAARYEHDNLMLHWWDNRNVVLRLYAQDRPDAFFALSGVEDALAELAQRCGPKKRSGRKKKS